MKKTKLTRSLLAACSIVALSAVMYGCAHTDSGPSQEELDAAKAETAAAAAEAQANADAATAAVAAKAEADAAAAAAATEAADAAAAEAADAKAAADAAAAAAATAAADAAADAKAAADEAAAAAATAAADAAAAVKAAADKAAADAAADLMAAEDAADDAQEMLDEAAAKAASATAKALKGALGKTPLRNLTPLIGGATPEPTDVAPADSAAVPSLNPNGLMLGISARNADGTPAATLTAGSTSGSITAAKRTPRMAPGDSPGMLGDWAGTDYAHTSSFTGVSNTARAYRNRAAEIMTPFASGASFGGTETAFEMAYVRATRTLNLGASVMNNFIIAADMFPTAGTTTYTGSAPATDVQAVVFPGTYQGAEGNYHCGDAAACSATRNANGSLTLGGDWDFVHEEGAMITSPDGNFLYFGWWLQKDASDTPALASAFTGFVSPDGMNPFPVADVSAVVTGTADYAGHAAGKFAISNPIGDDDAGHFTADAMLSATFGASAAPNFGGVSGTLDNFMANEAEVDWEVTLLRRDWDTMTPFGATQAPMDDPTTTGFDESLVGTIWSVDGATADASGSWSAQMYDETPDDGSNVPTSVTGTFESHFGAFVTMVGAFGAERTE